MTTKKVLFIILSLSIVFLSSCKKKCVSCRQFKIYDGDQIGKLESIKVEEACGRSERKSFTKDKQEGSDSIGKYKTFWECALWEEDK